MCKYTNFHFCVALLVYSTPYSAYSVKVIQQKEPCIIIIIIFFGFIISTTVVEISACPQTLCR